MIETTKKYSCDLCDYEIEDIEGMLIFPVDEYEKKHICKKCLNKMCELANTQDLRDEDLFA